MADGTRQTPSPEDIAARAQASAPTAQGEMDRICLPCRGLIAVEACYTDRWCTPLTNAPVTIEDSTGVVSDEALRTEPLAAHGLWDGDAPVAPLVTMGSTPPVEVALGAAKASIRPQGGDEADAGMEELGAALTAFRDNALGKLGRSVAEWEALGQAGADGVVRIRQRLNQYQIEVDPNILGADGIYVMLGPLLSGSERFWP